MARRVPTLQRNLSGRVRQGLDCPPRRQLGCGRSRRRDLPNGAAPKAPEIDQAKCPAPRVTMPFAIWRPRLILRAASGGEVSMKSSLPAYVKLWFAADLFLALFP